MPVLTKTCPECLLVKPTSEFYNHPAAADKLSTYCKDCTKIKVRANRELRKDYYRAYDRLRGSRNTSGSYNTESKKEWRLRNADKVRAQGQCIRAVKAGKIVRPTTCSVCGKVCTPHGHHHDYTKPLDVLWVCSKCHSAIHRKYSIEEDRIIVAETVRGNRWDTNS